MRERGPCDKAVAKRVEATDREILRTRCNEEEYDGRVDMG